MYHLTPAYGRDYKSAKEVKADWEAGKDFQMNDISAGIGYINKDNDLPKPYKLLVRFKQNRNITIIEVKK